MAKVKKKQADKVVKELALRAKKKIESNDGLREQYNTIRKDLLKLKKDVKKGVALAKNAIKVEGEKFIWDFSKVD